MSNNITITKASLERVSFSPEKLSKSLERAGANSETISSIIQKVETGLYDGITTKKIYQKAFSLLRKASHTLASKYKLKQAIMELGPSGYPFEKYVGEILKYQGFDVQVGVIVEGHCVNHEIDVIAEKDNKKYMIECKYHSRPGIKSSIKIPLYIHARFKDVEKAWRKKSEGLQIVYQPWIFTNTKFTLDAIQYAGCTGLQLIGWDYPHSGSLKERIEISGLYPITCLNTLNKSDKNNLLSDMVVIGKEIIENPEILIKAGIESTKHDAILSEIKHLSI